MIGNRIINSAFRTTGLQNYAFSTVTKKKQMEVSIKTPYSKIYSNLRNNFGWFLRIFKNPYKNSIISSGHSKQSSSCTSRASTRIFETQTQPVS